MIGGAATGAGGPALGTHLVNHGLNESISMGESRGVFADTVPGAVAELTDLARDGGHRHAIRHAYASPPPGAAWDEDQWTAYWALYEKAMGLDDCPFTEAIHDKSGADGRPPHRHRVYLTLTERGTLVRIGHDYARQEAVSRIVEHDTGAAFVKGAHNIRAERIARQLGRDDVADAMAAAGLLDGARARAGLAPSHRAQQERTGVSKQDVAAMVAAAWRASDSPQAFAAALREQGIAVAQGDKKAIPVIVDSSGNTHGLRQMLGMAARAEGSPAPKAADIAARMDGAALPTTQEARQAVAAHVPAPPDDGSPPPDAPTLPGEGQVAPVNIDAPHIPAPTGHAEAAPGHAAAQATPGAALDDAGPGPGEPPGPTASPEEEAQFRARLAAYDDRKAAAWARWLASQQQAAPSTAPSGGEYHGTVQQVDGWTPAIAPGHSAHRACDVAPAGGAHAEIHAAPIASQDGSHDPDDTGAEPGHDQTGGSHGAAARGDDTGHTQADGRSVEPAARPGSAAAGRDTEPDNGNPVRTDSGAGIPTPDRAATGGTAADARQAVARRAAEARLAHGLAGQPQEMDRMRQARQELDPVWREMRNAQRRIHADQARIEAILATHPHPNPASRDPAARADAYAHAISERTRQRTAEVDGTHAQATAAVQGRSRTTRLLAFIGIATAEQRQAESLVAHAVALADAADTLPTRDDYTHARADGEAHAYAARQTTATWEARPDVATAMEQHRLNQAVHVAVAAGDQAINAAMDAGDPNAARAIIRAREEEHERRAAAAQRLADLARGPHGYGDATPPSPGRQ